MGDAGDILHLEIETEEGKSRFELPPGKAIVIGRRDGTDVRIPRSSVSQDHLKILWTGTEVIVTDLGSKFGTFRLPQDSPFKEASFPPVYPGVELRLFKSNVKLTWRRTESVVEPTEVVSGTSVGLTKAGSVAPSPEAPPLPPRSAPERKRTVDFEEMPASSAEPRGAKPSPTREKTRAPFRPQPWQLVAPLAVCVTSVVAWFLVLRGVARAPSVFLRSGGALDALALWAHFVRESAPFWLIAFVAWIVLSLRQRRRTPPALDGTHFALGVLLWAFAVAWPSLWSLRYGLGPAAWGRANALYAETTMALASSGSTSVEELQSRVQKLKTLKSEFAGSSLLYKSLLDLQRSRVLRECGGLGEAPWENKKVCLILLFAVSIETLEEVKPGLLGDLGARASILLSLDGLTRLLSVEGSSAPMIPFFLESLELVGLQKEKEDIGHILAGAEGDAGAKSAAETLKELRRRIESRFDERQAQLGYPPSLRLSVPGPLESGI